MDVANRHTFTPGFTFFREFECPPRFRHATAVFLATRKTKNPLTRVADYDHVVLVADAVLYSSMLSKWLTRFSVSELSLPLWSSMCRCLALQPLSLLKTDIRYFYLSFVLCSLRRSLVQQTVVVLRHSADEWDVESDVLLGGYPRKISFSNHAIDPESWRVLNRYVLRKHEFAQNQSFSLPCIPLFNFPGLVGFRDGSFIPPNDSQWCL